jgi:antitoxin component YwqK of YwqJK toxin-antitoxin module
LLFALLAIMTVAHGQRDTVRKYLDAGLYFTNKRNMVYPALSIRMDDHWLLMAFYPDTSLLAKIYYKNAGLTIKDGPYSIYTRGGIIAQEGHFINNIAEGNWQSWYVNGQPHDSGLVKHNHFAGRWKHWYKNGQLKIEHAYSGEPPFNTDPLPGNDQGILADINMSGVLDGPWQSWYSNGVLESSGVYSNDTISGVWKWYRENGLPSSVETYANGKIIQLECYDEKGMLTGSTCSILKEPVLVHPFFSAHDYILDQLHRVYNISLEDEGSITINFTVTKTGKIVDLIIKNVLRTSIKNVITQIFEKMPAWSPAVSHNRAIDYALSISVN